MKSLKLNNIKLSNFFLIISQSLIIVNFVSLYILTQYKDLRFNEIIGPYFRPNDKPGFGFEVNEASIGYHFFGDLAELMFYARNIDNLNLLDLKIHYPPTTLLFLKLFENLEIVNILIFFLVISFLLIVLAINKFELKVNKYLILFAIIFTSKSFLSSIDRGNLEFVVFSLLFFGFAYKNENPKISLILFTSAVSLKPSVILLLVFLNISSLFLIVFSVFILNLMSYIYLKINPYEGILNYLNGITDFNKLFPPPLDYAISNVSIFNIISNFRYSDFIIFTPLGTFLQVILNHISVIGLLFLFIYFLFIKFTKIDIYNSTIHLASYISIFLLFRQYTGVYTTIYFVIPLIVFFTNKKPKRFEMTIAFIMFLSLQPIQIFINKDYLIQKESLELFYRFSASSLVLVIFIITIFYNLIELKNYKKNKFN